MRGRLGSADVWFKIALLVVFGAFYVAASRFPEQSRQFPQLLALVSLALTVLALVTDFVRRGAARGEISGVDDTELTVFDAGARRLRRKRYYLAWAIIIVAAAVGFLGGFIFSTLALFAGYGLFLGERKKLARNVTAGAALMVVVYLVFGTLMKVPLLGGFLG